MKVFFFVVIIIVMRSVDLVVVFHCCEKKKVETNTSSFVVHSIKAKEEEEIIAQWTKKMKRIKNRHQTFVQKKLVKRVLHVYLKSTLSFRSTMEGTRETQRVIRRTDNTSYHQKTWINNNSNNNNTAFSSHINKKEKKRKTVAVQLKNSICVSLVFW